MKVAILSDIHSNLEALQACCRKARAVGVEQYLCLGDIIGYGADPVATMELVMSLPGMIAVRGNHEEAVLKGEYPGVSKPIQESIRWTRQQLLPEHFEFIRSLPYVHTLKNVTLAHASVHEPEQWDYLYDEAQVKTCMEATEQPLTFLGHTHIPKLYYETPNGEVKELHPRESVAIPIYQRRRYVANVGSVGQPRDGTSLASFVIHDTDHDEVTFYRIAYDFTRTAKKILEANLAPGFAERLAGSDWLP